MNFQANRRRWSDNDHYLGPFTYAKDSRYRPLAIELSSGCEEYVGAQLRFSGFGHTLIIAMPSWLIRPYKEKVHAKSWSAEDIERIGRNWYWNVDQRQFGFSYSEGFLQVFLGRSTGDSRTDKTWGKHLPWTQWRFVRHSYYDLNGEHHATLPDKKGSKLGGIEAYERDRKIQESVPTRTFEFLDYDGEKITATTMIEEREWKFGTGWFKWLSLFRKNKISRSLDIAFSAETGKRKGSWKGGTIGHGIDMFPGELHEEAFRRYCPTRDMTFIGEVPPPIRHKHANIAGSE